MVKGRIGERLSIVSIHLKSQKMLAISRRPFGCGLVLSRVEGFELSDRFSYHCPSTHHTAAIAHRISHYSTLIHNHTNKNTDFAYKFSRKGAENTNKALLYACLLACRVVPSLRRPSMTIRSTSEFERQLVAGLELALKQFLLQHNAEIWRRRPRPGAVLPLNLD